MDENALLAAIAAHPDDDVPRLAYADWLEDSGDPDRAEFVRVQCEVAREPPMERLIALRRREWELLSSQRHVRLAGLAGWDVSADEIRLEFRRGMAEGIRCLSPAAVAAVAAGGSRLAGLAALNLWLNDFGPDDVASLVASPDLAKLRSLDMGGCRIGDAVAEIVAASPHLAGLTNLNLGYNLIGDGGATAVAASPHLRGL